MNIYINQALTVKQQHFRFVQFTSRFSSATIVCTLCRFVAELLFGKGRSH